MGDYIAYFTVPAYILTLNPDRASGFTTIFAFENIPTLLFGFFGGVIVDRMNRRRLALYSDLWRAGAFGLLALLAANGQLSFWVLAAVAFLIGSLAASFNAALLSYIPSVVASRSLALANSRMAVSQQIAFAVGPITGAILLQVTDSFPLTFMVNGATFVVSAISLIVARPLIRQTRSAQTGFRHEIMEGLRFLWMDRVLRLTVIAGFAGNFVVGFVEPTLLLVSTKILGLEDNVEFGLVFMAFGIGGVLGALTAPMVIRRIHLGRTFVIGFFVFSAGLLILASGGPLPVVLGGVVLGFIGLPWSNVAMVTIRQVRSPDEMLGRITAASRAISWGSLPMGAVLMGYLSDNALGLQRMLFVAPVIIGLVGLVLLFTSVWSERQP